MTLGRSLITLCPTCKMGEEYQLYWDLETFGWDDASAVLSKKGRSLSLTFTQKLSCGFVHGDLLNAESTRCTLRSWAVDTTQPAKSLCSRSVVRELGSRCVNQ